MITYLEKKRIYHRPPLQTDKSQPEGERIIPETIFTEVLHYPLTRGFAFLGLHRRPNIDCVSYLLLEKTEF